MRIKKPINELSVEQLERRLERLKETSEKVDVLLEIGKRKYIVNLKSAIDYILASYTIAEKLLYKEGIFYSAQRLATYYNSVQGDILLAQQYCQRMEQSVNAPDDGKALAILAGTKGSIAEKLGDYDIAEALFNEALGLQRSLQDSTSEAHTLTDLGHLLWKRSRYDESRICFQQALEYFKKLGDKAKTAGIIHNLGVLCSEEGKYADSIKFLEESIEIKNEIFDKLGLATSYHTLGTQYVQIGDYDTALEYFGKSLDLKEELKVARLYLTIGNIGFVYSKLELYNQAYEYYQKAYSRALTAGDKNSAIDYQMYSASVLVKQGKYDASYTILQSIESEIESIGDPKSKINFLQNIAAGERRRGDYVKAIEQLHKATRISVEINNTYLLVQNLYALAELSLDTESYSEAIMYAERCIESMKTSGTNHRMSDVLEILSEAYYSIYEYQKAYLYLQESSKVSADELRTNSSHKLNTLLIQFDVERTKKDAEINRLKSEQLERELEMKKNELTALALHLVNKNEFLVDLREQIGENIEDTNSVLKTIADKINISENNDNDWKRFEDQFLQVNPSFSKKLMDASNNTITKTELKICQLLKTGLSSKEVANIMFLSKRTVDTHRHNIHKKLRLKDIQLVNWLMSS